MKILQLALKFSNLAGHPHMSDPFMGLFWFTVIGVFYWRQETNY
jgi:hypothetical protein